MPGQKLLKVVVQLSMFHLDPRSDIWDQSVRPSGLRRPVSCFLPLSQRCQAFLVLCVLPVATIEPRSRGGPAEEVVIELQLGVDVQAQVSDGGGRAYAVIAYRDGDGFHFPPAGDEQSLRLVVSCLQAESLELASLL
ncbi:hypothetical protein TKK_0016069 [Trichogramma kaykai]